MFYSYFGFFKAKYKINNNNKTNTKHEFNAKYERYKQDISKDRKLCLEKNCNI